MNLFFYVTVQLLLFNVDVSRWYNERCLRVVYTDKTSSFEKLLEINTSVPMQLKNLQILATEIFRLSKDLRFSVEFFPKQSVHYNLRHASEFSVPNVKNPFHDIESLPFLAPKCPCRVYKKYVQNISFI